jgi:CRP-like cAMP-binding protein
MACPDDPKGNRLLAALAGADWQHWRRQLEFVDLRTEQPLYEPGQPQRHAYFPANAVVSLQYLCSCGKSTQIAFVGGEGVVGISLILGGGSTTGGASVLIAGQGFRIGAQAIQDEFGRSDATRRVLLRYYQALATQIAQAAICNRHHTIEQQMCSFLLHILDRLRGGEVVVTQELIANMLGVRRESVTAAAGHLQAAGLITHTRGHITVIDPVRLERRSCECHAVVKKEYDRLLPREPVALPADPGRRTWPAWKEAPGPMHAAA